MPTLGMPIRGTPKFGEAYITVLVIPTAEELNALKTQATVLKAALPPVGSVPECSETTRIGKWSMV